jgi:phosphate starvation-inducible protein PhoH
LTAQDIVRNTLVGDIVEAYGKFDEEREVRLQEQRAPRQLRPGT